MAPLSSAVAVLSGAVVALAIGLAAALIHIQRDRSERRQRGPFGGWGVPRVPAEALDPRFAPGPAGPKRENEIAFVPGAKAPGAMADFEIWVLCLLARDARRIFEFGAFGGRTAYLLARNAPGALVATLAAAQPDAPGRFFYEGATCAARIEQFVGDSIAFDETRWHDDCDLVFVHGAHARAQVESDSRKALRMAKPGGWIVWRGYRGPRRNRGVFRTLNALAKTLPLKHVAGTSLVVYRRPAEDGPLHLTNAV